MRCCFAEAHSLESGIPHLSLGMHPRDKSTTRPCLLSSLSQEISQVCDVPARARRRGPAHQTRRLSSHGHASPAHSLSDPSVLRSAVSVPKQDLNKRRKLCRQGLEMCLNTIFVGHSSTRTSFGFPTWPLCLYHMLETRTACKDTATLATLDQTVQSILAIGFAGFHVKMLEVEVLRRSNSCHLILSRDPGRKSLRGHCGQMTVECSAVWQYYNIIDIFLVKRHEQKGFRPSNSYHPILSRDQGRTRLRRLCNILTSEKAPFGGIGIILVFHG